MYRTGPSTAYRPFCAQQKTAGEDYMERAPYDCHGRVIFLLSMFRAININGRRFYKDDCDGSSRDVHSADCDASLIDRVAPTTAINF